MSTYTFRVINDIDSIGIDRNEHRDVLMGQQARQTAHRLFNLALEKRRPV